MAFKWFSHTRITQNNSKKYDPTAICLRVGPEIHPNKIDDFFSVRGVVFIRGIVEHQAGDIPRFFLFDGTEYWPMRLRADKIHSSSETRTAFSLTLDTSDLPDVFVEKSMLVICFKNEHLQIEAPASMRLKSDHFLNSEKVFWDAVKSHPGGAVIEIGSRARSGITRRSLFPPEMKYIGFDISSGENVDVTGDAHRLSDFFPRNTFDFAFSVSVWEHLAMPWKVSIELNRVLKMGGIAMINSHQCWPSHEEPWDYFRFSEYSWNTLFNQYTGFEILDCGHGIPAIVAPAVFQKNIDSMEWHYAFLASRVVARKVSETSLLWDVPTDVVAKGTYPH